MEVLENLWCVSTEHALAAAYKPYDGGLKVDTIPLETKCKPSLSILSPHQGW